MSCITYKVEVDSDGSKHWYDGPAYEDSYGSKLWYLNDKLHREDGPAIEYSDGIKYWYLNGKLHREDGPAVEYSNGSKRKTDSDGSIVELFQNIIEALAAE